jgi:hypothetical protein
MFNPLFQYVILFFSLFALTLFVQRRRRRREHGL